MDCDRVQLDDMRNSGFLTDITLVSSDGSQFQAHRAVLASTSSFFHAYFRNQVGNNGKGDEVCRLDLPLISPGSLAKCLEVAYVGTTKLVVGGELEAFLKTASFLQMPKAISICEQTLIANISTNNLDAIYTLSDRYSLPEASRAVKVFLERRLVKISLKDCHLKKVAYGQLLDLLKSEDLMLPETTLLKITLRWLEASGERSNLNRVRELLRQFRLMLVDRDLLISILPLAHELSRVSSPGEGTCDTFKLVYEALEYSSFQPTLRTDQNKLRAHTIGAVRVAGKCLLPSSEESLTNDLTLISGRDPSRCQTLTSVPDNSLSHHQAVVVNDFIFVMGGAKTICQRGLSATNIVYRYDPRCNMWWQAEPMLERRAYFAAGSVGNCIYVAGGEYRFSASRTAEVYNPERNEWSFIADLPNEYSGSAGCACGGYFFTLGGWKGDDSSGNICSDVYRYDPSFNLWSKMQDMTSDRAFHCCISIESLRRIYVFGGVDHRKRPISSCEYFDLDTLTWYTTAEIPSMHNEGSCFSVFDDTEPDKVTAICVCGGYDAQNKPQTKMALYDIDKEMWSVWQTSSYQRHLRFAGSCFVVVRVPVDGTRLRADWRKPFEMSSNWVAKETPTSSQQPRQVLDLTVARMDSQMENDEINENSESEIADNDMMADVDDDFSF